MKKLAFSQPYPREISLDYACYLLGHGLACIDGRGSENTYLKGLEFGQEWFTKEFKNNGLNQST